ncbi:MAG: glycosyltransferase [Akkermansiaceae bacterium]|jgi:glycosyltransferase involved in cell wall biosynthesis|nr:glycosyltransferase [Akkermansiaceae bacterium]
MKILHLNTHDDGGSHEVAAAVSRALRALGHDSTVVTRGRSDRTFTDRLLRRGSLAFAKGPWHGTRRRAAAPDLELLRGVDVVHLHTVADWFDLPGWLGRLPAEVRVVVGLHDLWHLSGGCFVFAGCEAFASGCRRCPLLRFPADRWFAADEIRRKTAAYHDRRASFVANSEWLRVLAERSPVTRGRQVTVVPPPVDLAVFTIRDREACRRELGLREDDLVVATGCAAVTDSNKDTAGLLGVLAELGEPCLHALVFGAGTIPAPAGLRISWLGKLESKEQLAKVYAAADVFTTASRMETYGLTLVEALCCGTPVVAHRVGGIPEAAPEGDCVSLCVPGDRAAFGLAVLERLRKRNRVPEDFVARVIAPRNGTAAVAAATLAVYESCEPRSTAG